QRLPSPRSKPAKPGPLIGLRLPLSPGRSCRNGPSPTLVAGRACGNRFTDPSGCLVRDVCAGPINVAAPSNCQFVGQVALLSSVTGKPDVQRARPESCQPPITASVRLLAFRASHLPLPNGSSMSQFELN